MNLWDCYYRFLVYSLIDYSDFETILACQDSVYKEFTDYAISYCGQTKETIDKFFYEELIPACKEWMMDKKLEALKEDFND